MIFVVVGRWRKKVTREVADQATNNLDQMTKEGVKFLAQYWTLGRYDIVSVAEAKDEKTLMKWLIRWGDLLKTETLVAVPRAEAIKLVE
jgi:uncharacterized protein with GYD domain